MAVPNIVKVREERDEKNASRKKMLDYHKNYNDEHAEDLSKAKKNRYATDPAYKEAAKKRAGAAYKRRRKLEEEIRKVVGPPPPKSSRSPGHLYCPTCLQSIPKPPRPIYKMVGKRYAVAMYTIKELARRLGKQTKTVQLWVRDGVRPDTLYKDRRGKEGARAIMTRLWTQDQVEMLMKVFAGFDLRPPVSFEKIGLLAQVKASWDDLRPLGIYPALYTVSTEHGLLARVTPNLPVPSYARKGEHGKSEGGTGIPGGG